MYYYSYWLFYRLLHIVVKWSKEEDGPHTISGQQTDEIISRQFSWQWSDLNGKYIRRWTPKSRVSSSFTAHQVYCSNLQGSNVLLFYFQSQFVYSKFTKQSPKKQTYLHTDNPYFSRLETKSNFQNQILVIKQQHFKEVQGKSIENLIDLVKVSMLYHDFAVFFYYQFLPKIMYMLSPKFRTANWNTN